MNQWKSRRLHLKLAAAASVAVLGLSVFGVEAAFATAGTATIIDPSTQNAVTSGGSATTWTFKLPAGASCSKDTATNNYHVYSYVVPSTTDPSTLTFGSSGPSSGYPLVDTTGSPYIAASTAVGTGAVQALPNFNWQAFTIDGRGGSPGTLPAGTYNVGIACGNATGGADNFWNAQVVFAASNTDPNGETWSVASQSSVPESPMVVLLPLSAVVLLGGGFVVVRRRRLREETMSA